MVVFDPMPLRRARRARALRLSDVGAQVGRDASLICRWESGDSAPSAVNLARWLDVLDVDAAEVFRCDEAT